jgi:hypothetical protein
MRWFPAYRCEHCCEGPWPDERDHYWTMHIIEWLGYEFVLKVPRKTWGDEASCAECVTPADDPCFGPFQSRLCPTCAEKFSAEHPVVSNEQLCPECAAKCVTGGVA